MPVTAMQRTQRQSTMMPPPLNSVGNESPQSSDERVRGLVRTHHDFIRRSIRRLGVPEAIADDVSQHVFLTAFRKLDFIEPSQERAYLFGIARRVASDARRAMRRLRYAWGADPAELDRLASPALSPEELLEHKRRRELVDCVVSSLPTRERKVFVLHEFDGLALTEIASRLGLPEGTVASQLRRGRANFEAAIERIGARRARPYASALLAPFLLFAQLKNLLQTRTYLGSPRGMVGSGASPVTSTIMAGSVPSLGGIASWISVAALGSTVIFGPEPTQNSSCRVHPGQSPSSSFSAQSNHTQLKAAVPSRASASQVDAITKSAPTPPPEVKRQSPGSKAKAAPLASCSASAATAPTPSPSPRPETPRTTQVQAPSLQRELALLRTARALVAGDDPAGALDLLERYARTPGAHVLAQEAKVLRVQALAAQGAKNVARVEGVEYLRAHPTSPQAPRIQRFVEEP